MGLRDMRQRAGRLSSTELNSSIIRKESMPSTVTNPQLNMNLK